MLLLSLLVHLDDLVDLLRQLVGQRRHIEKDAVHIDGVGDLVLYNQLEYLYVAFPLLYCGEALYHELSVRGIHLYIIFDVFFLFYVGLTSLIRRGS